ncbi:MAG: alpha-mannosidase [Myxococcales bacterium]|nr:alpha-mannosidase [Myxococcales bacterium]
MKTLSCVLVLLAVVFAPLLSRAADEIPSEEFFVTGASHIDLAWKWPYTEGEFTCKYTFATVLRMMDEYDDTESGENPVYYAQSSALAYRWMEESYPEIFQQIQKRVKEGRWEIVGGMWVESDALQPSGESFCRQFLTGQWYFQDKFGRMATIGWLPDSFGFNANLPQFMHKSGIDRFFFYKLNWNDTHKPQRNLFYWKGPDGSRVLTHLAYNAYNNNAMMSTVRTVLNTKRANEPNQTSVFYPLGTGDHGGGIVRFFMTRMLALRDAGYHMHFGKVADFFDDIDLSQVNLDVQDELYFEKHRGTYTTRANHKKSMRELEYLLQDAEIFASFAYLFGEDYPFDDLDVAWKRLMRDQFHDTMSGTALDRVYQDEVEPNLEQVRESGTRVLNDSLAALTARIDTTAADQGEVFVVFNPNAFAVTQPVELSLAPAGLIVLDETGAPVPSQANAAGDALVFLATDIPGWGWRTYQVAAGEDDTSAPFAADDRHLENDHLRVTLDEQGYLTGFYSKDLAREFIPAGGRGNLLQLYRDNAGTFDCWDIGFDKYQDEPTTVEDAQSVALVENGPVRQVIEIRRQGEVESYVQRIVLYAEGDYLDFETQVFGWGNPKHRFLKVAFPTTLVNDKKEIRTNIPYGNLVRVLDGHRADWEFAGQKWIDLTETHANNAAPEVGLSLIAREKYGYDVQNDGPGEGLSDGRANILRLSLLKSGTSPLYLLPNRGGPVTDQGDFAAHYRLIPHAGDTRPAEMYLHGEEFANRLIAFPAENHGGELPATGNLVNFVSESGVVLPTTLKRPYRESADGELILRLVEIDGQDAKVSMGESIWEPESVYQADILERPQGDDLVAVADDYATFTLPVGHNAVETVRVVFSPADDGGSDDDQDGDDDNDVGPPASDDDDDEDGACCG